MHRDKFPEKVPFRLTRMLIKAMEVCGVEGSFRSTCERTMGVLRDNRDSLVAMLEAFVYDPLISWRLLGQSPGAEEDDEQHQQQQQQQGSNANVSAQQAPPRAMAATVPTPGTVLHGTIQEEEEDGVEEENEGDADEREKVTAEAGVGFQSQQDSMAIMDDPEQQAMSAAHAKSLQMYNNMQSMAAALSASARIASVTGGDANRAQATEGSLARSRVDRSVRQREILSLLEGAAEDGTLANDEALNEKALKVIRRVQNKLAGTDFLGPDEIGDPLDVQDQVRKLIVEATSSENLSQLFIGWCAFW